MKLDRLDRAALSAMTAIAFAIGIILWRGDQVGVQIIRTTPAAGSESVAIRAALSFTFSEAMIADSLEGRVRLSPETPGVLRWNGATAFFAPASPLQPNTTYTMTIEAGARSQRGRLLLHDVRWSFRTGHPRVVYLSPALDIGNLYLAEIDGATPPRQITFEPYGVFDFAISPDGARIVYSANRDSSGARDLWLINLDGSRRELLVACDQQVCQSPSWAADSVRIAFERRALIEGAVGRAPGPARIWLIDSQTRQAAPLFGETGGDAGQKLGALPRWAPLGDKLSYYDPLESAISIVDTRSGEIVQLPGVLGDSGAWSPDASQLIYSDLVALDTGQFSQMLRADLTTNVITPVTALTTTNDASIAWSPSGAWIAFSRQSIRTAAGFVSLGPQVWVSQADNTEARALTDQPEYSYGGLRWSPDEKWIAVVRNNLRMPNPKPEVWLIRVTPAPGLAEQYLLATDATIPAWTP